MKWIFGLSALPFFPVSLPEIRANPSASSKEDVESIGSFFKGEELSYEIGFWLLNRVAIGRLSFKEMEHKGYYISTLQGETLGVLGFVSRYRVDTYRAVMTEVENGSRLRPLRFEEEVKIGEKLRKRTYLFDYQRMKLIRVRHRKDGTIERREMEIPPGRTYDDFITASYNFRYGVYGKIERGRNYIVPTFPKKGQFYYEVKVGSKEEEDKKRDSKKDKDEKEYYVKLYLDPEITHSKEGLIEGWLTKELIPLEGTIPNVILFGDVRGRLVESKRV
ncbi:MAG: DUF3108 domain-containing protein [Thermodesulfobacteriota bacterium]